MVDSSNLLQDVPRAAKFVFSSSWDAFQSFAIQNGVSISWHELLSQFAQSNCNKLQSSYIRELASGCQGRIPTVEAACYAATEISMSEFALMCDTATKNIITHYQLLSHLIILLNPQSFPVVWSMSFGRSQDQLREILHEKLTILREVIRNVVHYAGDDRNVSSTISTATNHHLTIEENGDECNIRLQANLPDDLMTEDENRIRA